MQLYSGSRPSDSWLILLFIIFFFKPSPTEILGPAIGMKIADLLYLSLFILYFLFNGFQIKNRAGVILLAFLFCLEVLSIWKGALIHDIIIADILEISRPLVFLLAFTFGTSLGNQRIVLNNEKLLKFIFLLYVLFSIAIFVDFMGFKRLVWNFYELGKSRGHSEINVDNIWRLASTFTNPNYFGLSCTIFGAFFYYRILNRFNLFELFTALVFMVFILLSGSRTSLLAFVLVVGFVTIFDLWVNRLKTKKRFLIYFILFVGVFGVLVPKIISVASDVLWRFTNVSNMEGSFGARLTEWSKALVSIENNLMIGVGSNKTEVKSLDNNYLMILYKNGLVGLIVVLSIFVNSFFLALKLLNISKGSEQSVLAKNLSVLLLCSTATFLVGMMTAVPLFMSQLAIPYFILFGYVSELYRTIKNDKYKPSCYR